MGNLAISVENLGKCYRIGHAEKRPEHFRAAIRSFVLSPFEYLRSRLREPSEDELFWALKDVSFEVKHGEVLGIIGRNGAGKSTLLKILSRITEPTTGRAKVYGRVGSLLEVGTGFHPELTGRENIYLNGTILGMKRAEIDKKFDEIVDFSGVEKFLDTPVKRYSSGMYVRLAFAVAAHLEPEILMVDEVLAVGDSQFQKKCLVKMLEVAKEGRVILFVSHSMTIVSSLCSTCIYLKQGRIQQAGSSAVAIHHYLKEGEARGQASLKARNDRDGDGQARITDIRFLDMHTHHQVKNLLSGQDICIEVSYESDKKTPLRNVIVGLPIFNSLGQFVILLNSNIANKYFDAIAPEGKVYCYIPRWPLMAGSFYIDSNLIINGSLSDHVYNAVTFDVEHGDFFGTGVTDMHDRQAVYIPHFWSQQ